MQKSLQQSQDSLKNVQLKKHSGLKYQKISQFFRKVAFSVKFILILFKKKSCILVHSAAMQ